MELSQETQGLGLIAIVDDDPVTRRLMGRILEQAGFATVPHESGESLLDSDLRALSAVCLDLRLGEDSGGMAVMAGLQRRDPTLPVLIVTAVREVEAAVAAMSSGAYDYIVKPIETARLVAACRRAVERRELSRRVERLERDGVSEIAPKDIVPLSEVERREIERALEATRGNVGQAARLLGIGRATLYRRLAAYQDPYPRAKAG
jgi:DNA-binding NtrC family response regulator